MSRHLLQAANEIGSPREEVSRLRPIHSELADELRYAPEGNLRGYATSGQAGDLVRHLACVYPRVPQRSTNTTRTNKPRKLEGNFHRAIGAFLAALLLACADDEAAGWLRMSLDKEKFKRPAPVSYRMFNAVRSAWLNARLIEQHKGYPGSLKFGSPGPANGMMTRFRATPALLKLCERKGVLAANVNQHFHLEFEMPEEVLQLTRPSRPTPDTPAPHAEGSFAIVSVQFLRRHETQIPIISTRSLISTHGG